MTPDPPDINELELIRLDKDLERLGVELLLMRRRLWAVITGDRRGSGSKVVQIKKQTER